MMRRKARSRISACYGTPLVPVFPLLDALALLA